MKNLYRRFARSKLWSFVGVFALLLAVESGYLLTKKWSANRLPIGIRIAATDFGWQKVDAATAELDERAREFLATPLRFQVAEKTVEILPAEIDLKIGVAAALATSARDLIRFDELAFPVTLNEKRLRRRLLTLDPSLEFSPNPARAVISASGELEIRAEKSGRRTDFALIAANIRVNAAGLQSVPIAVKTTTIAARPTAAELAPFRSQLAAIIRTPLVLKETNYERFEINLADRLAWFDFGTRYQLGENFITLSGRDRFPLLAGEPIVLLRAAAVEKFVRNEFDPLLSRMPQDVKIVRTLAGKIEFEGVAADGRVVDTVELTKRISRVLLSEENEVWVPFRRLPAPIVATAELQKLGIVELVGEAVTSYAGSPPNRQHNIRIAAAKLNGQLLAPGASFSFVDSLGPITRSSGYREELIIKKGDLVPEVGGGVCQVSTTFFRSALTVGIPITEQKPHSLKVRYYDPPGLDATIYPGVADLKFLNDTGEHLLVQSVVEGTQLRVNFFGTSDGRRTELSGPFYPNGEPITDLAAAGLKMQWYRKLLAADGTETTERYDSAYRTLN